MERDIVERLHRRASTAYLTYDDAPAKGLDDDLREAADEIERLRRVRVYLLDAVGDQRDMLDSTRRKYRKEIERLQAELKGKDREIFLLHEELSSIAESATLRESVEDVEEVSRHVCGQQGYDPMRDPPCPACEDRWANPLTP